MRGLVTGVAGFIGSRLAEVLVEAGWEVIGCDSFTPYYERARKERNLEVVRKSDRFTFIEGDTRNSVDISTLADVDVVFHQAGQPGVRASWSSGFADYVDLNIVATQDLVEKIMVSGRARLVMASSSSVYGNALAYPLSEAAQTKPFSPYGVTKLAAERLALAYAENFGLEVVALRYFTVYGPRQRPDMAIGRLLWSALTGVPFPLYGGGDKVRDFTFVDDVVEANMLAATADLDRGCVLNICGGNAASLDDVLGVVGRVVGKIPQISVNASAAGDVTRTGGDNDLARSTLRWKPRIALDEGIALHAQWLSSVLESSRVRPPFASPYALAN